MSKLKAKSGKRRDPKAANTKKQGAGAVSNPASAAAKPGAKGSVADASRGWTFLTNHAHVLIALNAEPELVLREVAIRVGITERAVQRIVQDLEAEGIIRRERVGRQNRYEVLPDQPLRHPIEAHRNIGDLLKLISG